MQKVQKKLLKMLKKLIFQQVFNQKQVVRLFSSCGLPPPPRKIFIPEAYLEANHSRSSGPGGPNVNKVNTKVELRFSIKHAFWLPADVKDRLREQRPQNITKDDEFIVVSQEHRTQESNYSEALGKMQSFID